MWMLALADDDHIYKTARDSHTSHQCPGTAEKCVTVVLRGGARHRSKRGTIPVVHHRQHSSRVGDVSNFHQWKNTPNARKVSDTSGSTFNSMFTRIRRDPLLTVCSRTRRRSDQQNSVTEKDCQIWKPWLQKASVSIIRLWSASHYPVTVQPAEA